MSVPRNFNDGWVAELEGERLRPLQVDGWSQGWLLPDASGELVVTFAPQDGYQRNLSAGLVVLGGVLIAAAAVGIGGVARGRPSPPRRRDWWARPAGWAVLLVSSPSSSAGPSCSRGRSWPSACSGQTTCLPVAGHGRAVDRGGHARQPR